MNESEIPPLLEPQREPELRAKPRAKWRWAVHVAILAAYVLGMGALSSDEPASDVSEAALPGTVSGLLMFCGIQLALFGVVFGVAWLFSRANAEELRLRWRGTVMPVVWGGLHSILLRLFVAIVIALVALPWAAMKGDKAVEEAAKQYRPKIEVIIDPKAMEDPVYFGIVLTGVSFIVAGLREELWRAGMLAGLAALFPGLFASRKGQFFAVFVAAIIFGLGHAPQGMGAVALTAVLGIGLGAIIVLHRSIWEAVIAHGFFDAASFAMLWVISKNPDLMKSFGLS